MITYTDDTIGNQLSHFVQAMALKFRKVDDAIDQPEGRKSHEHYFNDTPVPATRLALARILWSQRNQFQERQCAPYYSNA